MSTPELAAVPDVDEAAEPIRRPVHEALNAVMADVRAVGKEGRNQKHGYNFRGIDGTLNAVGPAFRRHGVLSLPRLIEYNSEVVQVGNQRTTMRSVTLTVEYTFVGPNGDTLTAVVPGEAMDSGDKATSKAMSVALRTALLQSLAIPTDEPDPDESSYERSPRHQHADPYEGDQQEQSGRPAEQNRELAADGLAKFLATSDRGVIDYLTGVALSDPAGQVDISGSLDERTRAVLGVDAGAPCTLRDLAPRVAKVVAEHNSSVNTVVTITAQRDKVLRPGIDAETQKAIDEQVKWDKELRREALS